MRGTVSQKSNKESLKTLEERTDTLQQLEPTQSKLSQYPKSTSPKVQLQINVKPFMYGEKKNTIK